jgi:hypothetical protein
VGIQYVTVKVDTSGLYQPLSSAVGVVGIAGPAPSAGAGFSNPTLFTRPLVGASSEPYASVVPVLKVSALASALQTLSVSGGPTGGSFTASFGGQTSAAIGFNATAAQVQTALQATPTIGAGGVTCAGGPLPGTAVQIFFAGPLAFRAQALITIGTNGLTGGASPTPSIVQTTAGALVSDIQTISVSGAPTAGTFQLAFDGQTTAPVPFNATAAQLETALASLSNVGASGVVCLSGALPGANVTVTFAGPLSVGAQPVILAAGSTLTGAGSPTVGLAHTTTGAVGAAVQTLSVTGTPTGGGFALSFGGQTTGSIPFNATAAAVQIALTALGSIGAGNVVCTGGPLPGTAVTITFAGSLAAGPQPLIAVAANTLTGGTNPVPAIASTTTGVATADVQTHPFVSRGGGDRSSRLVGESEVCIGHHESAIGSAQGSVQVDNAVEIVTQRQRWRCILGKRLSQRPECPGQVQVVIGRHDPDRRPDRDQLCDGLMQRVRPRVHRADDAGDPANGHPRRAGPRDRLEECPAD